MPPTSKSTSIHRRSTLMRFTPCLPTTDAQLLTILDFKVPRLSSGVDYAPVVNNSRIEWTKIHQFATLWLAPTSIGLTVLSQDFCFTSKVHFTNFESQIFDVTRILILCSFICAIRRHLN